MYKNLRKTFKFHGSAAIWGGIWRAFFHDFSMWDVLWWILGCTLVALGRYSASGSRSGRPLGAERKACRVVFKLFPPFG